MNQLVIHRWFALVELSIVFACGIVIYIKPSIGGWIILIALLPMLVRIIAGQFKVRRTLYSVLLVAILLSAVLGIWAAYDRPAAWEKFWIILGAAALLAALTSQPRANLGIVAGLVGFLGAIIAISYILTNDWNRQSSDLELIERAGMWIMSTRPISLNLAHTPNFVGGTLAMIASIPIALGVHNWRKRNNWQFLLSSLFVIIILLGLALTSSRGAWLALISGFLVWLMWRISVRLSSSFKRSPSAIFLLMIAGLLLTTVLVVAALPGGVIAAANRFPALAGGESRYELAAHTNRLIQDFPLTGGGLRSFPGLFSQYIMVTPFFLFAYSHNFYLDISLELGFMGGMAIITLFLTSLFFLLRRMSANANNSLVALISEAVLVGFVVVLLHGLVDDALFGDLGSPLLFLLPGLALLLINLSPQTSPKFDPRVAPKIPGVRLLRQRNFIFLGSIGVVIVLGILVSRETIISSIYANLGALKMSHSELKSWPTNKWDDRTSLQNIESIENDLTKSLAFDENQRTAWHRLGLISLRKQDFNTAQTQLQRAYNMDPNHRGIRKSLAYTYVWLGEFEKAMNLLDGIDEGSTEMETYSWWWRQQDRPDLAQRAKEMALLLTNLGSDVKTEGEN